MNDWDEDKGIVVRDMSLGRVLVYGSPVSIGYEKEAGRCKTSKRDNMCT